MAVSKSKLFLFFVVGVCLAASAFIGILYVQLKDISNLEDLVARELSARSNRTVKIGSAKLDYKNGVRIRLQDLTLEEPDTGRVVFAAGGVWLSVRPLPLLNREIKIRKVTLENVEFQILRDKQGDFHFSSFNVASTSKTESAEWQEDDFSFWIKAGLMHEMTLRGGELHFVDHFVTANAEPTVTHVKNISLTLSKPILSSSLKYTLEGDLQGRGELPAQFNLFGKIEMPAQLGDLSKIGYEGKAEVQDLQLDDWQPYWDLWAVRLPARHRASLNSNFSGTLGERFEISGDLEHTLGTPQGPPVISDPARPVRGILDFHLVHVDDSVNIKKFAYHGGEWGLDATAVFSELNADRPKISWTLSTKNFPITRSGQYLPIRLLPEEFQEKIHQYLLQGDVSIRSLKFNGFLDELRGEIAPESVRKFSGDVILHRVELGGKISGLQGVNGTINLNKGLIHIKITRARFQGIPVQNLHASVNPFGQPAWMEGTLESQFDLQTFKRLLLREGSPGTVMSLIGSAVNLRGKVRARVRFQGPMDQPGKLALQGNGVVEGVGWENNAIPWPVENVKGDFEFKSPESGVESELKKNPDDFWEVRFQNIFGELGAHQIENFGGELVIDGEASRKRFNGKIILSHIRVDELFPEPSEGKFQTEMKKVFALGGEIDVDYRSSTDPKAQPVVVTKGTLNINEMILLYTEGYRPLQRLSADVIWDENKIIFESRQGWYGESAVQLYANVLNYKTPHPKLILKIVAPEFIQDDFEDVPFLDRFEYQGSARMDITINSTDKYFKLRNHIDLTRASYEYGDFLVKPKNVANSIELFAQIKPEGLVFKNLIFSLGEIQVSGKGRLDGFNNPEFVVQLASKNLNVREAAQYIKPLAGARRGRVDFQLTGKGNFDRPEDAEFKGRISLQDGEYQHEDLQHPFTLNTQLRFINNQFEIQSASLVSERSRFQVKGTYVRGPVPMLKLTLEGTSLYPADFAMESEGSDGGLMSWLGTSEWFMKGSGEVAVKLGHFYQEPWRLDNVLGRIFFHKGVLETKNLKIGVSGKNRVRLDARWSLEDPEKPKFKTSVAAWEISAEGFGNIFGDIFYKGLTGEMRKFVAEAQGQGKTWEEIAPTLNGKVSLGLENGTVHTGRLLNGLQSLFGLSADPEVEEELLKEPNKFYQEIVGDFVVTDGRAHTENFVYGDVQKKISLVGQFDLEHNTMDIVVGVAPMRGLDKIIKEIPMVGGILTGGEEESLVKIYYTVAGPFEDPETTTIPFTSLGKKVVGIFQGIVQAPAKLFSPSK